jgi:DNA-binding CsgD family transcriptional regulator
MANKPVIMNKIKQRLNLSVSIIEISRIYGLSRNTIKKYRGLLILRCQLSNDQENLRIGCQFCCL